MLFVDAVRNTPSPPARSRHRRRDRVLHRGIHEHRGTAKTCDLFHRGGDVDPDHPAPIRAQQLSRKQADQPKADYSECFPQRRRRKADSLKGNGGQDRKHRFVVGHSFGDLRAQVQGDAHHLGVGPVGHHAVAGGEPGYPFPDFKNRPAIRITERQRPVELRHDRFHRREDTVGADLLQDLAYLVGLLPRLIDPPRLAEFYEHSLGAR